MNILLVFAIVIIFILGIITGMKLKKIDRKHCKIIKIRKMRME